MQKDTKNLKELWDEIVGGADLPEGAVSLWLTTCMPVALEEDELVVDTTNPFTQEYITKNFLEALNRSARNGDNVKRIRLKASVHPEGEDKRKEWVARAEEASRSRNEPGCNLNPHYTFSTFVVGKSNRLAHAASLAVAEMPGKAYNPLFIWGGVGLGKTHLMHAICHYALSRSQGLRALYLSAEKFLNEFVQAIGSSKMSQFKDRYRNVDILLIDDIQFLGNKGQSQEEFFHTFNTLHEGNKQVVICSDRQPSELQNIEDRLISRFAWGLVTDIQPPDLETRIAILQKKATFREYDMPDEVIHFLAQHIPSNIRELEGALNRVIACAELSGEPITIDQTSVWLKDILRMDLKGPVTIESIQAVVAESFGMSPDDLASSKRTADIALARQIAMYLCRELTELSLQKIGHAFRKKDHTTVIHAQRKIGQLIKGDPDVKRTVDNIRNKL
ncbi:chromosomal replication initiator protein DnaA [Fretibacterium sp. OH1220_COT-178]|uniref:chromosomal replication initiator protein DnaA n=1 Tax=Fretibacterium sp. OH1220_COT-178 TaxID=2491047 RepID=UPI000F5E9E76|nr:chromosomal replication initiator protein DnaA [Fretibacterium sp. OH1220_COT-178]RRD63702.1 chromosomal replication initiator protein DnaA [Fretibacterium sp. OH1220_COT-178]